MKKDKNSGDLFTGFNPEPEQQPITVEDICRIFNGRVISKKEAARELDLIDLRTRSGEAWVKSLRERGVRGDVEPDKERVEWYKMVFAKDKESSWEKIAFLAPTTDTCMDTIKSTNYPTPTYSQIFVNRGVSMDKHVMCEKCYWRDLCMLTEVMRLNCAGPFKNKEEHLKSI